MTYVICICKLINEYIWWIEREREWERESEREIYTIYHYQSFFLKSCIYIYIIIYTYIIYIIIYIISECARVCVCVLLIKNIKRITWKYISQMVVYGNPRSKFLSIESLRPLVAATHDSRRSATSLVRCALFGWSRGPGRLEYSSSGGFGQFCPIMGEFGG